LVLDAQLVVLAGATGAFAAVVAAALAVAVRLADALAVGAHFVVLAGATGSVASIVTADLALAVRNADALVLDAELVVLAGSAQAFASIIPTVFISTLRSATRPKQAHLRLLTWLVGATGNTEIINADMGNTVHFIPAVTRSTCFFNAKSLCTILNRALKIVEIVLTWDAVKIWRA
jgi:hypothetical protein